MYGFISCDSDSQLLCFDCGALDHWSRDCPSAAARARRQGGGAFRAGNFRSGGFRGGGGTGSTVCFKCHQRGHWARNCPY